MEETPEVQPEAIISDEQLELELNPESAEDIEAVKASAVKATTFAKQALARAHKAEEELKELKKPKLESVVPSQPDVEETVLLANGMPEELLEELKAVAGVRKVSLIKAQKDPIFVAVKEKFEKEQKQKDASLGASRGSGATKPKKDFSTPGLTREEHRAMVLG